MKQKKRKKKVKYYKISFSLSEKEKKKYMVYCAKHNLTLRKFIKASLRQNLKNIKTDEVTVEKGQLSLFSNPVPIQLGLF